MNTTLLIGIGVALLLVIGAIAVVVARRRAAPQVSGQPSATPDTPYLELTSGLQIGQILTVSLAVQTIGRDESVALHVSDPQGVFKLSRRHANVWADPEQLQVMIEDLGSTHGVLVNGKRADGPTALPAGAEIALGKIVLQFHAPQPDWWAANASVGERRQTRLKPRPATEKPTRQTKLKPRKD